MAKNYASVMNSKTTVKATPQTSKSKKGQKRNNAGGYSFKVDMWTQLNRYLILGIEGGTMYLSERKMNKDNAKALVKCIKSDGKRVVDTIVDISTNGRSYKQDVGLFALAMCVSEVASEDTRRYAFSQLSKVARIGTHLFTFVAYADQLRNWGSAMPKAVAKWYNDMDADRLAYQVCKYQSRSLEGELPWSHVDLLRKSHAKADNAKSGQIKAHQVIYKYVTKGREAFTSKEWSSIKRSNTLSYIWAHEEVKRLKSAKKVAAFVRENKLVRESVPTEFMKDKDVALALLEGMPVGATLRSLGPMTANGLFGPLSDATDIVVDRLTNDEVLKRGKVHPLGVLIALKQYSAGRGLKGSKTWTPNQEIVAALNEALQKSFGLTEASGKKFFVSVDVSGSMGWGSCASNLTYMEGAAALAMSIAKIERKSHITAFSTELVDVNVSRFTSFSETLRTFGNISMGGTDCSQPMLNALERRIDVDCFVVLTDNETWAGHIHPHEALERYRASVNPNARLAVVALSANKFSIADPSDSGMIDIAGFDSNMHNMLSGFANGEF